MYNLYSVIDRIILILYSQIVNNNFVQNRWKITWVNYGYKWRKNYTVRLKHKNILTMIFHFLWLTSIKMAGNIYRDNRVAFIISNNKFESNRIKTIFWDFNLCLVYNKGDDNS